MNTLIELVKVIVWPATVFFIVLLFRDQVTALLQRIKRADLPGGVSVETFPEEIGEAKSISTRVREEENEKQKERKTKHPSIPLNEVNARLMNLGLSPSSTGLDFDHYRILAERDPNLALAGMRMEVEIMLKNLATGFKVKIRARDGAGAIVRKLYDAGALTTHQSELLSLLLRLCNSAVHGVKVTAAQVEDLLDIATVLRDQFIAWLSWGFSDEWRPPRD